MMPPAAKPARSLEASYIIEASAGTGKTTTLVSRIVDVLRGGIPVDRIAAVTFTNAAAGEMKIRVRQRLEEARASTGEPAERRVLATAQEGLERAFIGTIHAFCTQLLRRRPVEAGIDPAFQELAQPEAQALFGSVFRPWVLERIAAGAPALERTLARLSEWESSEPLRTLQSAAWDLADWRDFPAPWTRREFDREAAIGRVMDRVAHLVVSRDRCAKPGRDPLWFTLEPVAALRERVELARTLGPLNYDSVEAELLQLPRAFWYPKKGYGVYAPDLPRESVLAELDSLLAEIDAFRLAADADLVVALRDELWRAVELYEDAKLRAGQLDFMDLLIKTRNLLRNPHAREWFRARYDRLFVDEFQDTDPLQAEILLTLASSAAPDGDWRGFAPQAGKLFVVGDPKQSIYRFRRADVTLYGDLRDRLRGCGVERDSLQQSARSVAEIQHFVNAAFQDGIGGYLPLTGGRPGLAGQPAVVALPLPAPYGTKNFSRAEINACSPGTVAAMIAWLADSQKCGWRVSDRDGLLRPIAPADICILFRRFTSHGKDLAQEYVRALEARGIEHVLVGSKSFHQREEVGSIRTALRAIEWPEDELSVYATLRTFFGLLDSTLVKFRHLHGRLHPYRELPEGLDEEFEAIAHALDFLRESHARRNAIPVAATLNRLLEHTRMHAAFAFRKGGRRVLANVYRVFDLARSFESSQATSFRSFVRFLEAEADGGEAGEAPIFEQNAEGVKLMTVHKAKGLEYPVVILADLAANLTSRDGCDRYLDPSRRLCAQRLLQMAPPDLLDHAEEEAKADRDEALRLAYVAATRARDLLIVSAVGAPDFVKEGGLYETSWLAPLYPAIFPPRERWRRSDPCPGFECVGDATVLKRPSDWDDDEDSVRPGLHRIGDRPHEVLWFDPAVLELKQPKVPGLDHEAVLSGTPEQIKTGLAAYRDWQAQRERSLRDAAVPAFRVARAIETHNLPGLEAFPVETVQVAHAGGRPASRQFGRLVHMLLERAGPGIEPVPLAELAKVLARMCGAQDADLAPAVEAVRQALGSEVLTRAAAAGRVHRELPVIVKLDDGRLVEGRADLAYFDGKCWTVVDFKTGPAANKRSREQLQLYALALQQATGQPVRPVLLEV